MSLDIGEVSSARSFVFLWCGSCDGLDLGRLCLQVLVLDIFLFYIKSVDVSFLCQNWGFRRCEDICWIRTNIRNKGENTDRLSYNLKLKLALFLSLGQSAMLEPRSVFQRTKEHCLMGIKGTVRKIVFVFFKD